MNNTTTDEPMIVGLAVEPINVGPTTAYAIVMLNQTTKTATIVRSGNGKMAIYDNHPGARKGLLWMVRNMTAATKDGRSVHFEDAEPEPKQPQKPKRAPPKLRAVA